MIDLNLLESLRICTREMSDAQLIKISRQGQHKELLRDIFEIQDADGTGMGTRD